MPEIEFTVDIPAELEIDLDDIERVLAMLYAESDELPFTEDAAPTIEEEMEYTPFDDCEWMCGIPEVNRVLRHGPATIVFWEDGTKTVVKCMEGDKNDPYAGFAAACMKKMFGSTTHAKNYLSACVVEG